jgi:hypothetical protein
MEPAICSSVIAGSVHPRLGVLPRVGVDESGTLRVLKQSPFCLGQLEQGDRLPRLR